MKRARKGILTARQRRKKERAAFRAFAIIVVFLLSFPTAYAGIRATWGLAPLVRPSFAAWENIEGDPLKEIQYVSGVSVYVETGTTKRPRPWPLTEFLPPPDPGCTVWISGWRIMGQEVRSVENYLVDPSIDIEPPDYDQHYDERRLWSLLWSMRGDVTDLGLSTIELDREAFDAIVCLRELRQMTLDDMKLNEAGIRRLASLDHLESLAIEDVYIPNDIELGSRWWGSMREIRYSSHAPRRGVMEAIVYLNPKRLILTARDLSDPNILDALSRCRNLRRIVVGIYGPAYGECDYAIEVSRAICAAVRNLPHLESIELYTPVDEQCLSYLSEIKSLRHIRAGICCDEYVLSAEATERLIAMDSLKVVSGALASRLEDAKRFAKERPDVVVDYFASLD